MTLAAVTAAACNGRAQERPAIERTATAFYDALSREDGVAACALLAPETIHEVEKSEQQPCGQAITDEDLPAELGAVDTTNVYGSEARIRADQDTVFVADFGGTWRIVAAGCTARVDQPYDCTVQGG